MDLNKMKFTLFFKQTSNKSRWKLWRTIEGHQLKEATSEYLKLVKSGIVTELKVHREREKES